MRRNLGNINELETLAEDALLKDGWIDLEVWTGRSVSHIPVTVREIDEPRTHCSSLMYLLRDPACDPRSGGIAGVKHLAMAYGISEQQFRRNILPHLQWVRWLANIPVTNVSSLWIHARNYQNEVYKRRCHNLGINQHERSL